MIFRHDITDVGIDGVHLRPLAYHQAEAIFDAVDRNRDHLKPWLPFPDYTNDVSDTKNWIKSTLKSTGKGQQISSGIWHKRSCIGMISFNSICKKSNQGEIGYWLDKEYTGNGIMSSAVSRLIKFGFEDLSLNKITIIASAKNYPSRSIARRLGFVQDAILRCDAYLDGEFHDNIVFSMLADEWNTGQTR